MIGAYDLQIAAAALHYGYDVATLNPKDFRRISGLQLIEVTPFLLK